MFGRVTSRRSAGLALLALMAMAGAACGDGEDRPGQVTAETPEGGSGSASASASGAGGETTNGADGYTPVSDVAGYLAMGDDVAAIKEKLAKAKEGGAVDWPAVKAVWEQGGASKKSDGSMRTLKGLAPAPDVVALVDAAIAGGPSDAVRAQQVEKGATVMLARKVVQELDAAAKKVGEGKTAPADGAPHNVDEAWGVFTAKGNGPAATADKRAADFKREGKVREPIVAALAEAQKAAGAGDAAGLTAATAKVRTGLEYVFYLATHKYLAGADAVARAEGAAFYLGIAPTVKAADPEADTAVAAAFQSGDAAAGRAALHKPAVLTALGIDDTERVDR
jgi:hypothetical protein